MPMTLELPDRFKKIKVQKRLIVQWCVFFIMPVNIFSFSSDGHGGRIETRVEKEILVSCLHFSNHILF